MVQPEPVNNNEGVGVVEASREPFDVQPGGGETIRGPVGRPVTIKAMGAPNAMDVIGPPLSVSHPL